MGQSIEGLIETFQKALLVTAFAKIWFDTDLPARLLSPFFYSAKEYLKDKPKLSYAEYALTYSVWYKPLFCKLCFCFWLSFILAGFSVFYVWIISLVLYKLVSDARV